MNYEVIVTMQGRHAVSASILLLAAACLLILPAAARPAESSQQVAPSPAHAAAAKSSLPPETRGDVLMAQGKYMDAIKAYREAPKNSPLVWNKMGIAWQHLLATDEAKHDYERALRIKPRYPEAMNNLGTIYYEEKDYKEAEKLYRRALKLMPRSATFYNNLGAAYFAQGKFRQGASAYQNAFAIDPAVFNRASFQGVVALGSTAQLAHQNYCLAELFARAGMTDRAIEYLRKALNEGFTDRKRLKEDQNFSSLRKTAAFSQLMTEMKKP